MSKRRLPRWARPEVFATSWARSLPLRIVREAVQVGVLTPVLGRQVALDVHGLDELRGVAGPVLLVANHSSHLDTAVLMATLPPSRRRRTAVAVADYFFDSWWRAGASAVVFAALPIPNSEETLGGTPAEILGGTSAEILGGTSAEILGGTPAQLAAAGWSVIVYPEGTRSCDGFVGAFQPSAFALAIAEGVPIVPVGLRGTYAAMPRGRSWPALAGGGSGSSPKPPPPVGLVNAPASGVTERSCPCSTLLPTKHIWSGALSPEPTSPT